MAPSRHGIAANSADVLGLLRDDQQHVLQEFREFERLQRLRATRACQRVAQRTFAELKVLAGVERELLYPAVEGALTATDLIDQSEIEHARIERTVAELEGASPLGDRYWRRFRTLGEYVRRHVEDEEDELFPMLALMPIDWARLYDAMNSRRAELAAEFGVPHERTQPHPAPCEEDATEAAALEHAH